MQFFKKFLLIIGISTLGLSSPASAISLIEAKVITSFLISEMPKKDCHRYVIQFVREEGWLEEFDVTPREFLELCDEAAGPSLGS